MPRWSPSNPSKRPEHHVLRRDQEPGHASRRLRALTASPSTILTQRRDRPHVHRRATTARSTPVPTTAPVTLGSWPAADGRYTVRTVIANDGNEIPAKQGNNTSEQSLFIGRGASVPWQHIEAEDARRRRRRAGSRVRTGRSATSPVRRPAVVPSRSTAPAHRSSSPPPAPTNTLVTRFSIPDSRGGGGITSNLNVYVNGQFHKAIDLTSKYMWQYGNEAEPRQLAGSGRPAPHLRRGQRDARTRRSRRARRSSCRRTRPTPRTTRSTS